MTLRKGEIATTLTMLTLGLMFLGTLIGARTAVISRLNSLTPRAQTSCPFNTRVTVYQDTRDDSSIITFDETFGDSWKVINDKQQDDIKFKKASGDKADLLLSYDTINPLYNSGDLASVRLRGPNDDDWDIVGVFCDNKSTTTNGCPEDIDTQNQSPQRLIQNFKIECGVDIHYGWVLRSLKSPSAQITPKSGSTGPTEAPLPTKGVIKGPTITQGAPASCTCKSNPGGERYCSAGCQARRADGWCTTDADCVPEGEAPKPPTKPDKTITPPKKPVTPPKVTVTPAPPKVEGPKGDPTLCSPALQFQNLVTKKDMSFNGPIRIAIIPSGFAQSDDATVKLWIRRMMSQLDSTNLGERKANFSFVYHKDYSRRHSSPSEIQESILDCNAAAGFVLINSKDKQGEIANFINPQLPLFGKPYIKLTYGNLRVGSHIFPRTFGTLLGLWYEFLPEGRKGMISTPAGTELVPHENLLRAGYPENLSTLVNCFTQKEVARSSNQSQFKKNCTLPELFALKGRNVMGEMGNAFDPCVVGVYTDNAAIYGISGIEACKKSGGLDFTTTQLKYVDRNLKILKDQVAKSSPKPTPIKGPKPVHNDFNGDGQVNTLDVVRCLQGGIECSVSSILFNLGSSK